MALKFEITGDNSNLLSSLDVAREGVRRTARDIEESGLSIEDMFKRIGAAVGVAFTFDQAKNFVRSAMEIRGQFQQLEIAFNTMLQSEEKATMLMSQLVETAAKTPFDLQGVAQGAKQLLAYGIAADEVNETITRLGDIAAGLSIPLGDLVYLYGTTMTQGRMFTMDLRQFMGRGIPMAEELAKQFGVTKNEVAGLVTAGQVGADAVKQAIWNMTNEGSRFGGLMEAQSKSITGQISNIEDAFDTMLNDIGKSNEGLINDGLAGVSFLIENYEKVGRVLLGLVAAYGEYKAALMVTSAIQKSMAKQANEIEATRQAELQAVYDQFSSNAEVQAEEESSAAIAQNTASREGNVTAIDSQIAALERKMIAEIEEQDNIYKTSKETLDVLKKKEAQKDSEIETLKEQISTAQEYIESEKEAMESAISLGDAEEAEAIKTNIATESKRLENLQGQLGVAQKEKNIIADQRHSQTIATKTALTQKQTMQEKLSNMQKAVSVVQTKAQTTATGLWVAVTKSATAAMNSLKAAIMTNPFGVALAAITTLITLLPMFSDEASKASAEVERFGESAVKQTRNLETLFAVVENTSSDSLVHKDAIDELCKIYEEYGFKIDDEIDKLEQLRTMHDLVTDAIHREGEERQKANLLASYEEALKKSTENMRDTLQNAFENAEWDSSGTFEDWDAEEYQEKADQLTQIIGSIIESEGDSLATLTGDELEAKIQEVNERIKKAYEDMGMQLSKSFVKNGGTQGAQCYTIDAPVDVDAVQIMRDYAEAISSVTNGRKALLKSYEEEKKANPEVRKEVDYTSMSISELAKIASEASDNVSDLGDKSASPTVDKTSIDAAYDASTTAKTGIDILNGTTAKPLVDTSSIGFAIGQTNTLLGNMFQLQNFGIGGGKNSFSLGFNPNQFGFGKKPVWGSVGGKPGVQWMPNIPITDTAILAQQALDKKVNGANSQKKVDDLLKEVNEAFNNAEFDSKEYKFLEGLKKRLEAKSRKNSGKDNKGNKVADAQDSLEEIQVDLELDRIRAAKDLETRVAKARLDSMTDVEEKVRLLQDQQNKEELESIERQKEDAVRKYIEEEKKIFEQREKVEKAKNPNYKGKKFDESSIDTSEIEGQYDELIQLTKNRQLRDAQKDALDAMREYLKEYGSFEQQRLATTEEYEEKIAKATTQGEKLRLQKERDQKLGSLEYENIAAGIDWKALFSGMGSLSKEMMQPMMDKLMAYTKTDEYLNADSHTQQDVAELIQELRQYLGTDQSMTWQALGKATEDFMAAVGKYNQSVENEIEAVQRLEVAKYDLKAGNITQASFDGIKADVDKFGKATQEAKESMEGFGTLLNEISEQVSNYTSKLTAALNNAKGWTGVEGFDGVQQAVGQIDAFKGALDSALPSMVEGIGKTISEGLSSVVGSGLSSMGNGLTSILSSGLGQTIGFVAQIPRLILDLVSNVKQFVTGILDSITELISLRWIDDLVVSVCDAISNLINAIFDLPENLFKVLEGIVVNGIGGLLNSVVGRIGNILSFGVLSSGGPAEWFTNSNAKEVTDTINRLTEENKNLEQAIEDLKGEMEKSRGAAAIDISRRAADLQEQTNENYKQMAQAQAGYHGSHHSWNYYWGGYNQEQINRLSNQIGRQWNGDIWDLSPEEMKMLRSNVDMWKLIADTGKGPYGESVQEKLNDYIDQAGKLQEITDALYENLTTTTKDNVFDDFLNSLYELADGSEDVFDNIADEWQKMVNKMVINNLIGDKFKEKLDGWYEELAKLNEAKTNGEITDTEYRKRLDALKAQYEGYVKDAERDVETMRNEGIIKATDDSEYNQEASSKGFKAMSQDTGDEMNGRFAALQISNDSIAAQAISIYTQMIAMTAIQTSSNNCLIEIRNMMISANSYLEDVAKYSKKMYVEFGEKLDSMIDNTKNL